MASEEHTFLDGVIYGYLFAKLQDGNMDGITISKISSTFHADPLDVMKSMEAMELMDLITVKRPSQEPPTPFSEN